MNVQSRLKDPTFPDANVAPKQVEAPADGSAILELLSIAQVRAKEIAIAAGAVLVLATIVTFSLTPLYTGETFVMVDEQQNNTLNVQQVLSNLPTDQASILNEVQILQSNDLATRVINKLRLDQDPEFTETSWLSAVGGLLAQLNPLTYMSSSQDSALTPEQERQKAFERIIDKFERRLTITQVGLSTAIQIDFDSRSRVKATAIANAIAEAFVEDQLNARFEATQKATEWLSSRLGQLAEHARIAEAAVEKYKVDNHLTETEAASGTGTVSVLDQQIATATTQLMQAQTDRALAEANAARVASLVHSGNSAEVSQVVNSPLISQLRQSEAQVIEQEAEMSQRYGPLNPKMLDLQAEKREFEAKIGVEIGHVVGTAENDAAVARAHESVLRDQLAQLEAQSGSQGSARVKLRDLEATAVSSRALYDAFVERSKQTAEEEGLQIPNVRIISRAEIPLKASFPNLLIVYGVGIPLSLIIGFMFAVLLERMDNGFRRVSRVEELLGFPVLATLPELTESKSAASAAEQVVEKPLSSFSEAIRGIQLGLALSNVDRAPKSVVVTSALPGEGKTTTALALARHLAQTGQKVVLVDGDLRRPSVQKLTGVPANGHDLIDVLQGTCSLDRAIVKDPISSLSVLPAINHVKTAPDLLESQAMSKVVANLRAVFDIVIIDSAPILPVHDTKSLVRLADAVLFVVRWEKTPRDAAADAVKELLEFDAPVTGVILTRADVKRLHYYSFGYSGYNYSSYSKYYESAY